MLIEVKYFYEKTDQDYITYNDLWANNNKRIVFLQIGFKPSEQLKCMVYQLNDDKDILSIRFPLTSEIKKNKIINKILLGKGIKYDTDKIWYPKEIWIYCPK